MKRAAVLLLCACSCCLLFLYSPAATAAARDAFLIWQNSILPALLPFTVCAFVMRSTGAPCGLERWLLTALAFISGAPAGACLAGGKGDADSRTAAALNLVSPMFIYASFAGGMLHSPALALPIIAAQFAAAALVLALFPPMLCSEQHPPAPPLALLGEGLSRAMPSMLGILSAMIFFMAVTAALGEALCGIPALPPLAGALLSGMLEVSGGCLALSRLELPPSIMAAAAAFLFSFGGVCIFAQSLTFSRLSAAKYFSVKLLQGCLAAAIALLITPLFPAAAQPVFRDVCADTLVTNTVSFAKTASVSLISMAVVFMIGSAARRR